METIESRRDYISKVAIQLAVNVPPDLMESLLAHDSRPPINKVLLKLAADKKNVQISTDVMEDIDNIAEESYRQLKVEIINSYNNSISEHLSNAQYHVNEYQKCLQRMYRKSLESMVASAQRPQNMSEAIKKALVNSFYTYKGIEANSVVFETGQFYLTHRNSEAAIDYKVLMGPFSVEIELSNKDLRVKGPDDRYVQGYIHPHVSSSGIVCLGNVAADYSRKMAENDLAGMLAYVEAVLKQYNEESPYKSLQAFRVAYDPDYDFSKDTKMIRYWGTKTLVESMLPYKYKGVARTEEDGTNTVKVKIHKWYSVTNQCFFGSEWFALSGNNKMMPVPQGIEYVADEESEDD